MMNTAKRGDTKQKLVDTALELLWKSSYGSVSVDDICKASGVKKGSFYHYFPSKMDLTIAAMEEETRHSVLVFDKFFSASIRPDKRFEALAEGLYEGQANALKNYGHVCGCPCTSIASEMAGQNDSIRLKFEEISAIKKSYFESAIRDMIAEGMLPASTDAKRRAQEVHNFISGEITLARIQNDLNPLRDSFKAGLNRTLGLM